WSGGRYDLSAKTYELVGNTTSMVVGKLCDNAKNVIAGSDRVFIKSRELLTGGGAVADATQWTNEQVYYYEMTRLASGHGVLKGIYLGDSTLAGCVAKEIAGQAGNDKVVGGYLFGGGQLLFTATTQAYNNTNLSIDALYVLD